MSLFTPVNSQAEHSAVDPDLLRLQRECEHVTYDMSADEIAKIDNLVFRAFALLHTRKRIDRQTFDRLAASVDTPDAGPLGLKVQKDLIAIRKADTLAKVGKIERQLEKRIKALDGFWRELLVGTAINAAMHRDAPRDVASL